MDPLTNEDVADILALLDSLPYDELDLETPRFRLTLRRTPGGWTQSTQVLAAPEGAALGVSPATIIGARGPSPRWPGMGAGSGRRVRPVGLRGARGLGLRWPGGGWG